MKNIFTKIRYKNFLSTGNIFTEIDLAKNNTTLIVGDNGNGKSIFMDAITFVLFGKAFRKINKPQLVNSITKKNLVVEIEFYNGTNHCKVVRGIAPVIFEVYYNDKLLNQDSNIKDYQDVLEKQILKVNYKTFCQVVILGSATFQPFMQLTTQNRREVIEDLLDLNIFSTMNVIVKEKLQKCNEEIEKLQYEERSIKEQIKLIKNHIFEFNKNNKEIIDNKKIVIEEHKVDIEKLTEDIKAKNIKISELKKEVKDENKLKDKMRKLDEIKNKIKIKLSHNTSELEFYHNNDKCPTCKQPIASEFKCSAIEEKKSKISELDTGLLTLAKEHEKISFAIIKIVDINSKINDIHLEIQLGNSSINSYKNYIKKCEEEIKELSIVKNSESTDNLVAKELKYESIQNDIKSIMNDKSLYQNISLMLKDNGIKANIVKQYIPIINKYINHYLSSMNFFVQFELDENFNETIKSRYRDDFSYASFSEGEKQKINLALLFAWRQVAKSRNSMNTNLLIMDEVFDSSLDLNSAEYLMNIIQEISENSNIFIISHREFMNDKFNNIIKIEKRKNFSLIVKD